MKKNKKIKEIRVVARNGNFKMKFKTRKKAQNYIDKNNLDDATIH